MTHKSRKDRVSGRNALARKLARDRVEALKLTSAESGGGADDES